MKKANDLRDFQKAPQSRDSAKYESRSVSFKKDQKKKNDPNALEQS